ncbi:MAG: alpha-N-arabinofuranosidase [Butyrivibrio sp.]|jgi:alpha-N-arabinofuranosidase|nr:alpha-N-arabinofuranosidase [Butyrivibrio sp.]
MNHIIVNGNVSKGTINKNIYGQFTEHLGRCVYEGIYVKEEDNIPNVNGIRKDVMAALKNIQVPVVRWPGGCFADTYHWKDGIGPKEQRKTIVNTNWGGVTEDNSFGTHEFMEFATQLGCDVYFSGNVGSGTVQELSDWIEYCNMGGISPMANLRRENGQDEPWNVKYWGIGNEAWGCGGNMKPEYYADETRKFSTYMRNYDNEHPIYKIASGSNGPDYNWTKTVCERAGFMIDAITFHHYTVTYEWNKKGKATGFTKDEYYRLLHNTLIMDELVQNHSNIIKQYEKNGHKIGLIVDEWGTWFDVEDGTNPGFLYQQNTIRDAVLAGINLNIFNNHCDTVVMTNIAQMINVLQAMILTEGEKMVLTPTYYVYDLFKQHMNAHQMESYVDADILNEEDELKVPRLTVSASEKDGKALVTVVNLSESEAADVDVILTGLTASAITGRGITGDMNDHNSFENPDVVKIQDVAATLTNDGHGFTATLPKNSVCSFEVTLK